MPSPLSGLVALALFIHQCQCAATDPAASTGAIPISNSSCTVRLANGSLALTSTATSCSDQAGINCQALFNDPSDLNATSLSGAVAGSLFRPQSLKTPSMSCENPALVNTAATICPKYCGFCCLSPANTCQNVVPSPINCADVTQQMCNDPNWRPMLAQFCPASCGLCTSGGCVDAVPGCTQALCFNQQFADFAATQCKRTCNKCSTAPATAAPVVVTAAPPVVPVAPAPAPVSPVGCAYAPDASLSCPAWARNGFCTNSFRTLEQRKQYCATTCKIC